MKLNATVSFESVSSPTEVDAYTYRDALSELFELEVELLSADAAIDLREVVGLAARLDVGEDEQLGETKRSVQGIVRSAEQLTHEAEGVSRYRVIIVPQAWLATQRRDSRIFQHSTIPDIVSTVYSSLGDAPEDKLGGSYPEREYTVQYGEADHRFASRLLAEAGITYFFDHDAKSALTLVDDSRAQMGRALRAPFRSAQLGHEVSAPVVVELATGCAIVPGRVSLTDFDWEKPALDLKTDGKADSPLANEGAIEVYGHDVGTYRSTSEGAGLAKQLLEALRRERAPRRVLTNLPLAAGDELTITEHPDDANNVAFLVIASETRVRFGVTRETRATVIDKQSVPFRPTPIEKPRIASTQTAIVVGEAGEEIDVDAQGRVKVAFHWDRRGIREGAPTRWIRVSQGWAGAGYGFMMLPRIGDEVIVAYLDGDPDEPLIVGRVHNGTAPPPLKLPAEKTRSIWQSKSTPKADGHNHIFMEDKAGAELLDIRAQLDMNTVVERHATTTVGKNATESVGANHTVTVDGDQSLTVHGSQGIHVDGARTVTVGGALSETSASHAIESGPIGIKGSVIGVNGSAVIGAEAPVISLHGSATLVGSAPFVQMAASGMASVTAPVTIIEGSGSATLKSGATVVVDGSTVFVSGASSVQISSGATVTVSAPSVYVTGDGTVDIGGGSIKIGGGDVSINGGTVAIN